MEKYQHGGNIHKALRDLGKTVQPIVDFSANINPLGPPDWLRPLLSSKLSALIHYPDPECRGMLEVIARRHDLAPDTIVAGNGTSELLFALLGHCSGRRVVVPVPSYIDYIRSAEVAEKTVIPVPVLENCGFRLDIDLLEKHIQPGDFVLLGVPNNPTGILPEREQLLCCIKRHRDVDFIVDEAFLDFVEGYPSLAGCSENLTTLHSMTKFYAVPGLRVGFAVMAKKKAERLKARLPPWSVNSLAQAFAEKALADESYSRESIAVCTRLREQLSTMLSTFQQIQVFEGSANYLLIKIVDREADELIRFCYQRGILLRSCENFVGLDHRKNYLRIAVRKEEENIRLLSILEQFFRPQQSSLPRTRKKTPAIMFQGTCSDAGKSILTTALCRIMLQDGIQVAPFKAQNMSLNSFVTKKGEEMGRAQVVQAQAARLDPDCRMNPILLKPNSETGSQVIVQGRPVANMSVLDYHRYKEKAWFSVQQSYDLLAEDVDAIVLEGAGSPGEVNLKRHDIVNMRMARYAGAPVILVGDIDRGGVYASFVGIMEVLNEWERRLVAGYIVNKFRGQKSLLTDAHSYLRFHTGRSVYGVVPYISDLKIPEEDSVSFKKGAFHSSKKVDGVEIVVLDLPHISNFTDIEPLLEEPDVTIRTVDDVAEIKKPDAIILPGTKSVIADLRFLVEKNLAGAILRQWEAGVQIIGICGGYQMLGKSIADPYCIETEDAVEQVCGLTLLPIETVIEKEKKRSRKTGIHIASGKSVFGYEIHHGISTSSLRPVLRFSDNSLCGASLEDNSVWGVYLHGIFDSDTFRRWFVDQLRLRKGLAPVGKILTTYDLEAAFDRLAETVRQSVDIEKLYSLMRL
ncbi:MAG: threonine-phosphate decarboxylase [Deltaproteobacteria bacterium]|nr:MAG: threonine-phosphate decarboxylase [Deltaproteobacteria bacterium]